jgi:hypothetical protein
MSSFIIHTKGKDHGAYVQYTISRAFVVFQNLPANQGEVHLEGPQR